ncbi:MAG TPA: ATP-binding protein [Bryobacteraceae bacterium]|nr:ATP-binding protein [Bryobacteraceae bacterium]
MSFNRFLSSPSQDFRLPQGHNTSLGEALAAVPDELGYAAGDGFRVVVHGTERELRPDLRDEVCRIGREAIANACRHSGANSIEVEVQYRPSELRIAVRDNGRGIDAKQLKWGHPGHRGLQDMRESADRIGAKLRLRSSFAMGTEIELSVPGKIAFELNEGLGGRVNTKVVASAGR